MTEIIIHLENLHWFRDKKLILQNVNWSVQPGEHWALLGLNGAGKTSLLNMITGYQFPTKGKVSVLGYEYGKTNIQLVRQKIGFVSSSLNRFLTTFNHETALEAAVSGKFASIGLYEEVTDTDWQAAHELLASFRIEDKAKQPFRTLSQGEQKRVLLARAFMANPELLILDEPCTGLDIRAREELLHALSVQIRKTDSSLLYVTHHIEEIVPAITHVLLIADGRAIAAGRKEEILTNKHLSAAFKLPVDIEWKNERPWLRVMSEF
ncbi:ABC transporter ATP-binding protein [Bacillus sp. B190/17]|uniref:ABC transporter ATP-binding protein n=1 Tax=Bacillus lumedeiriae TaxID=3058829 RepID=A0ABW8I701_9BACI